MKRRSFLSMFSAAAVAPALPSLAAGAPSRAMMGLATAHARKYPYVSVLGLSHRIGVTPKQAQALLTEMADEGIIHALKVNGTRPIYAGSKVYVAPEGSLIQRAQAQRTKQANARKLRQSARHTASKDGFTVDISGLMAHLRALCADRGMTVHLAGAA